MGFIRVWRFFCTHVRNAGVEKDFAGSSLVLALRECGESSQDKNMKVMNSWLKEFLRESRLHLHCKQLSLTLIGADSPKAFASGSWSKGQDSVVFMKFLPWLLDRLQVEEAGKPWKYIYGACRGLEAAMKIFHAEPVFMDRDRAKLAADNGYVFLAGYGKLAEYCAKNEKICFTIWFQNCTTSTMF